MFMAVVNFSKNVLFRGKMDCGDIDILLTRSTEDGKTHAGRFNLCYEDFASIIFV